jgi:hypothetical protein
MTICAAAICKWNGNDVIVCIADRLITIESSGGNFQTEKDQTKSWWFSPARAVSLFAGDSIAWGTVSEQTHKEATDQHKANGSIMSLEEIARRFDKNLRQYQKDRSADTDVDTILTGFDGSAVQLFACTDGRLEKQNEIGYYSVGMQNACVKFDDHLLEAKYSRFWELEKTMFLLFEAKKRAESVQGIGKEKTDVWVILQNTDHHLAGFIEPYFAELQNARGWIVESMKQGMVARVSNSKIGNLIPNQNYTRSGLMGPF